MATRHLIKGNEKVIHFSDLATIESNKAFSTFALHTTVVIVFLFGSRKLASWFRPSICDFLNEFIAMLAYCACFYSQDVMLTHFGYTGLFFAIFCHMYICHSLNEGHGENMPVVIVVILCGFFCGAVLHAVLRRFHRDDRHHDVCSALIYAAVFTFSHAVIGIYAAHPFITLSRLLGCMKAININSWPIPFIIHMRYDEALEDEMNEEIDSQIEQWNHGYNLRPRNNR
ncbi:hypothetical protein GCK72_004771 [Caenorhabditis remanei]|uniref:Uncharacterized protein n=1 Tax=Caenorhabditis remanei TaxID=31234 RepID=A0A6A5HD29_CAERE|nr:hypothetical protein GCK72_004771 [Caenorhabditis remanei]KAF1764821.1 hypothetical protein GCK72_004771 [Caenorhabditis remanei]